MDEFIRTGVAAKILGCSRQHVVDLCDQGRLKVYGEGVHRLVGRSEVEALVRGDLNRDARQSLWLHHAVAARVVTNPESSLEKARANLARIRTAHSASSVWLDRWDDVLRAGAQETARVLTAETPESVELRQNSPFAGVLTDRMRARALSAFRRTEAGLA
jgi:excisionase family DNA binding protein